MIETAHDIDRLGAALAQSGPYRVLSAWLGEGSGAIEIALVVKGEVLARWEFNLDGTPVPKRCDRRVKTTVARAVDALKKDRDSLSNCVDTGPAFR